MRIRPSGLRLVRARTACSSTVAHGTQVDISVIYWTRLISIQFSILHGCRHATISIALTTCQKLPYMLIATHFWQFRAPKKMGQNVCDIHIERDSMLIVYCSPYKFVSKASRQWAKQIARTLARSGPAMSCGVMLTWKRIAAIKCITMGPRIRHGIRWASDFDHSVFCSVLLFRLSPRP